MNPLSSIFTCLTNTFGSRRHGPGKSSPASSCSSSYMFNKPFQIPYSCEGTDDSLQDSDSCSPMSPSSTPSWVPPASWGHIARDPCPIIAQPEATSTTCNSDHLSIVHTDATTVNQYIIEAADETDPTRRIKLLGVAFEKHALDASIDHRIPSASSAKISSGSCSTIRDMLDCVDRHRQDGLQGGEEELQSFAKSGAAALRALLSGSNTGGGASVLGSGKVLSREELAHRRELGEALRKLYLDYSPCQ